MIRRLSDWIFGGHYEHRGRWEPKPHKCRLPYESLFRFDPEFGDIWVCKCANRYKCKPSRIGCYTDWELIKDVKETD